MRSRFALCTALMLVLTACAQPAASPTSAPTPPPSPTLTAAHITPTPAIARVTPPTATAQVAPTSSPSVVPSPALDPTAPPVACGEGEICWTASPMPVTGDGTVTLHWNAPGAAKVDLSWWNREQQEVLHAGLAPSGSWALLIADAAIAGGPRVTVYITAHYGDDAAAAEHKILDIPVLAGHAITSFTVSPREVHPGGEVTVSWAVAGVAQEVSITILDEAGRLTDTGYRDLATSGSLTMTVPQGRRERMGLMLSARDPYGAWLSEFASVDIACPDVWFFPNPPADCPWPAHETKLAVQHFEHGMMIWTEWEDRIYILCEDSPDVHLRSWSMQRNQWFEGMPEGDPSIHAPTGYYAPVRGFGQLWREGSHRGMPLVELLGWALEPEFGIEHGALQCNTLPKYITCYVGERAMVYVLEPEGSGWYVWDGPDAGN